MEKISSQEERMLYKALTSISYDDLWGKIVPQAGNKVDFNDILRKFNGYNFDVFYALQEHASGKSIHSEDVKEYMEVVKNHPIVEMLAGFIQHGFLDKKLKKNNDIYLELGNEVLAKKFLKNRKIREGLILPDGRLLACKTVRGHRVSSLWLYVNGEDILNSVRYTSSYMGEQFPLFSSTSDYVKRPSDYIKLTKEQVIAIYNIYNCKYGNIRKAFEDFIKESSYLGLTPYGEEDVRKHNAYLIEEVLGRDIFDSSKCLKQIHDEAYLI